MKKKKKRLLLTVMIIVAIVAAFYVADIVIFDTEKVPDVAYTEREDACVRREGVEQWNRGSLTELPAVGKPGSETLGFDLRSYDISGFSLVDKQEELKKVSYDSFTLWPDRLPAGFDPDAIMESGMNPGLGIRQLHEQGITGEGVSIAIIDQPLNVDHVEYADRIRNYEILHSMGGSSMHGAAVTSIAVGRNCGVAPGADVYYISSAFIRLTPVGFVTDVSVLADGIDRILEINRLLPDEKKIRVVSVSMGYGKSLTGRLVISAIERAKKEGVFVITTAPEYNYGFKYNGLGRDNDSDPDSFDSYLPGLFWEDSLYSGYHSDDPESTLLVPMDARTYACSSSSDGYEFCSQGGLSWSAPWLSGLYALCVQVKPDITPEEFIEKAFETGIQKTIVHDGKEYTLGTIVDPVKLIESF